MKRAISGNGDKCCLCFEIECGISTLGILQIVQAIFWLWNIFAVLLLAGVGGVGIIVWIIVMAICVFPVLIGAWYYFKFFKNKNMDTKAKLPRAHLMNGVSCLACFVACTILAYIFLNGPVAMGTIGSNMQVSAGTIWVNNIIWLLLTMALQYYWMGVTRRYAGV